MIDIKKAIDIIVEHVQTTTSQMVNIENALNKVAYEDIYAKVALPRFHNSAMDGYGVKLINTNTKVEVIEAILAGENKNVSLQDNQAIKIMTGANIPDGVEAIVPIEDVKIEDKYIYLPQDIKQNAHIRFSGEDVEENSKIISKGEVLTSAHIGLLASQGITHTKVYKCVRVAIFSTGKELKLHFEKLEPTQIYNSNSQYYLARLQELNCDVTFLGNCKDSLEDIKDTIKEAMNYDLIVTSGGASVGDADFTKEAFEECGIDTLFTKVDIKPGKPITFGKLKSSYVLNLPGNPLAGALVFEIFGKLLINKLSGKKNFYQSYIMGRLSQDFKVKKGKTTVIPGYFDGEYFTEAQKKSPGMVAVLNKANALIVIDDKVEYISKDSFVKIIPLYCWSMNSFEYKDFFTHQKD